MNIPSNLMLDNREEYLKEIGASPQSGGFGSDQGGQMAACALCQRHSLAYICIFSSNYVSVVDINEAERLLDITVGQGPLDIDINKFNLCAYVSNYIENTVSVIDLRESKTVKTIPVGKSPAGVRVSPDGRFLYVVHYGEPAVYVLDACSLKKITEIPLPSNGFQIDITEDGLTAFVSLRPAAQIAVIDLSVNLVVKVIAAGEGTECVQINPTNRLVFVSNEDGNTLTAVSIPLAEPAAPNIPTPPGPVGLAFSPGGSRLYCANRQDNSVSLFRVFTHSEITRIPAGQGPYGAAMASGGRLLVVTNTFEDTAAIIDTRSNQVISSVTVGYAPAFLAIL